MKFLMNYIWIAFIFTGIVIIHSSCCKRATPAQQTTVPGKEQQTIKRDYEKENYVKATVADMRGLDGCKFLLKLEDGKRLEPNSLDSAFMQDKLPVWIKYSFQKGGMSICMAGKMVNLLAIEKRETAE